MLPQPTSDLRLHHSRHPGRCAADCGCLWWHSGASARMTPIRRLSVGSSPAGIWSEVGGETRISSAGRSMLPGSNGATGVGVVVGAIHNCVDV